MTPSIFSLPRAVLPMAAAVLLVTACQTATDEPTGGPTTRVATAAGHDHAGSNAALTSDRMHAIAKVREATARFHDVEEAIRAGYVVQFPAGCAASPDGAQGFHYLNPVLAADAVIDPLTPELLMYEPSPAGRLELVGVDYVIPYSVLPANTRPKPTVLGVDMMNNDPLGVWALHIWSRRPNAAGMFAAWNAKVSCEHAAVAKLPELPQ
ncbi:MAG: hypothetical protein V4813_16520 [Gemmatimonadota bacterium]